MELVLLFLLKENEVDNAITKILDSNELHFDVSLQLGAQVHPDATSNENTRCIGSSGQGVELETIPAWD